MGYYEENIKVIEFRYPNVAEHLQRENKVSGVDSIVMEYFEARDGSHTLVVEKTGEKFRLNSAYRPLAEAKKWASQYEFQNIDVNVFMFGFGNGIFVRELLQNLHEDGKIFLMEPDAAIFQFILEREDITDILSDQRFHLYMGEESIEDLKQVIREKVSWANISTQIRCSHICYDKLYTKTCNAFWDMVVAANSSAIVRRDTTAYFAHVSAENAVANLRYIKDSNYITELIGKFPKDIPAIVVSAGPSLDKNIEELHKAKGKAFIIATDTAVRILEKRNISYDCMVTLDPAKPAKYITECPNSVRIPLFCRTDSEQNIMAFHEGRKVWIPGSVYLDSVYESHGMIFPPYNNDGGSVATSGFMVAHFLGLKTIVLIGQDLAYEGEKTHAGGYENHILNEAEFIQMIDGIDGNQVRSRHDWIYYRDWFEEFIQSHPEVNVIDATEGGALIHGSKIMKLSDVISEYCEDKEFEFNKFMQELPTTFEVNDYEPIRDELLRVEKGFKNICRKAEEGEKLAKEFLDCDGKVSPKKHDHIIKSVRKVNNFIEKQAGYDIIELYTYDLTVSEMSGINCMTGDNKVDELNSIKCAYKLYKGIKDAAIKLGESLHGILQDL